MRVLLDSPKNSGEPSMQSQEELMQEMEEDSLMQGLADDDQQEEDTTGTESELELPDKLSSFGIQTSEDLVRQLKAKEPALGGDISSLKIRIATAAVWNSDIAIANKHSMLTDWILETLSRDAKNLESHIEKIDEHVTINWPQGYISPSMDRAYWTVLSACAKYSLKTEATMLANRYPLPPLILAFGFFCRDRRNNQFGDVESILDIFGSLQAARTSRQPQSMDCLNRCLAIWTPTISPDTFEAARWMEVAAVAFQTKCILQSRIGFLRLIVKAWTTELRKGNNYKKAREYFLSNLLDVYAHSIGELEAVRTMRRGRNWVDSDGPLWDDVRSLLGRVSYEIFSTAQQGLEVMQIVLATLKSSKPSQSFLLIPFFLAQLCLLREDKHSTAKATTAIHMDDGWKMQVVSLFVAPAIEGISEALKKSSHNNAEEGATRSRKVVRLACALQRLLQTIEERRIFSVAQEEESSSLLKMACTLALRLQSKSDWLTTPAEKDWISRGSQEILSNVYRLDRKVFDESTLQRAILCSLHRPYSDGGFLDVICSSNMKSRSVLDLTKSCFGALSIAVEESDSSKPPSRKLIKTALYQSNFWEKSFGVAIRDFLSTDDVLELLDFIVSLLKDFPASLSTSTTATGRKRKRQGSDNSVSDTSVSKLLLHIYFASNVLRYISISGPLEKSAQSKSEQLHEDVVIALLSSTVAAKKEDDSNADALATAALALHDAMQEFCADGVASERLNDESWLDLSFTFDQHLDAYQDGLARILSSTERAPEVRVQALMTVLNTAERSVVRKKPSLLLALLTIPDSYTLMKEVPIGICPIDADSRYHERCIHCLTDSKGAFRLIWDFVAARHLPILDALAPADVLNALASAARFFLHKRCGGSQSTITESLLHNARNLELKRWREVICAHIRENIVLSISEIWTRVDVVKTVNLLSSFPPQWYPAGFFEDLWPRLLSLGPTMIGESDMLDVVPSFLTACLQMRSDGPSNLLSSDVVRDIDLCLQNWGNACSTNPPYEGRRRRYVLQFFNAFLERGANTQDTIHFDDRVEKLMHLFTQIDSTVITLATSSGERAGGDLLTEEEERKRNIRQTSMMIEAMTNVLDQIRRLLQMNCPSRDQSGSKVMSLVRQRITNNDRHITILLDNEPARWNESYASETLVATISLQRAAINLLYSKDPTTGDSITEGEDYRVLLDSILLAIEQSSAIEDSIRDKAFVEIYASLHQARRATPELAQNRIRKLLQKRTFQESSLLKGVPLEVFAHDWLAFTVLFVTTWAKENSFDAFLDSSGTALANASRQTAEVKEYETALTILLRGLSKPLAKEARLASADFAQEEEDVLTTARLMPGDFTLDSERLLQCLFILLSNSPEGTLRVSQRCLRQIIAHITQWAKAEEERCLDESRGRKDMQFKTGLTGLQFIGLLMSSRPILFRNSDVSAYFSLAAYMLSSRCKRDIWKGITTRETFTSVVTTLIDCIRLRREFVAQYLPQLALLLEQLLRVFHNTATGDTSDDYVYVHLSSQRKADLGLDEARLFNRLISAITSKSTSSGHMGGLPVSRIKSLAKPFSTHATYVLIAYVNNVTTTSEAGEATFAKGEIREEVKRAMYNLCDILGPWQKNVMMDLLTEEGGRIVMRNLWRGWETQRYKGG